MLNFQSFWYIALLSESGHTKSLTNERLQNNQTCNTQVLNADAYNTLALSCCAIAVKYMFRQIAFNDGVKRKNILIETLIQRHIYKKIHALLVSLFTLNRIDTQRI